MLRCPVCGARLSRAAAALRCPGGHSFDIARHGYVGLLTGAQPISGDDAPMVQARQRFLQSGSYARILAAVTHLASRASRQATTVVEPGCGTGYYLAGVLDALPAGRGLGLDSSACALRAAAKAHPRTAAATWDTFRAPFPVASASADVVLDIFAPRNPEEFHRILRPDGRLIVTRPAAGHLAQLRRHIEQMLDIDPAKEERLRRTLAPYFVAIDVASVDYTMRLTHGEAADLVMMTPRAGHTAENDIEHDMASALPSEVTVSVLVTAYQPQ
jgi:23S rRNA (guanine745-N1)-methyltransferase